MNLPKITFYNSLYLIQLSTNKLFSNKNSTILTGNLCHPNIYYIQKGAKSKQEFLHIALANYISLQYEGHVIKHGKKILQRTHNRHFSV